MDLPSRAELAADLKRLWESLGTLEFRSETYRIDEAGRADRSQGVLRTDFALASGARRSYSVRNLRGGEETGVDRRIFDGRKCYHIEPFPGRPDSISEVSITNQDGDQNHYKGIGS
jgi:hypothetical protein